MDSKDIFSTLKRFDAYPKTLEDFRIKTFGGAAGLYKMKRNLPRILFLYETFRLFVTLQTPEIITMYCIV